MARPDKRRTSTRPDNPLRGSNSNPRVSTRVTPERTARAASSGARQLANALGKADRAVQNAAARHIHKENAKARRHVQAAATKAAIEDSNNDRDLEHAKQREPFANEDYKQAYLKTHYGLAARDESDKMRELVIEHRNDPDFDAEQAVDDHISGVVDGLDDPTAVDVMVPRLIHEGEDLKHRARQQDLEDQQERAATQFNAWTRDQVESGTADSREGINLMLDRAQKSNISRDDASEMVVNSLAHQAVEQKDPSILDGLSEAGPDGASIADNPKFTDDIASARAKAEAAYKEQYASDHLDQRFAAEDAADDGSLSDSHIQTLRSRGVITESQAVALHNRNRRAVQSQIDQRQGSASFYTGGLAQRVGYDSRKDIQGALDRARTNEIRKAEANGGTAADGLHNYFRTMIQRNGAMKDQRLENDFQVGYSQRNSQGTATDGLQRAAAQYRILHNMRGGDKVLARNMTDAQQEFFERYSENHRKHPGIPSFARQ